MFFKKYISKPVVSFLFSTYNVGSLSLKTNINREVRINLLPNHQITLSSHHIPASDI